MTLLRVGRECSRLSHPLPAQALAPDCNSQAL
jgi:hypothetical protein